MPALDPCSDGCANHIVENRPPGATDDPCNNSNLGYFCIGSIWQYDPTLPGADTATDGDCPRAWIRMGDGCNVDEWLEIAVANIITDTVAPVNGVDCCPPGTIWRDTVSGLSYISLNDGTCDWCEICSTGEHTSVQADGVSGQVTYQDPGGPVTIPPGPVFNLDPLAVAIVNPSATRSMAVQIVWTGYEVDFSIQRSTPGTTYSWAVQPNFYIDAVLQNNPPGTDRVSTHAGYQGTVYENDAPTNSWTATVVLAPGAPLIASVDATFRNNIAHNADISARIRLGEATISIHGSTI